MEKKVVNVILEGARGMGKSTVAQNLRQAKMERVLYNHTGLNADTLQSKIDILTYYDTFLRFTDSNIGSPFTFIHDRFFMSEMVMSSLYKQNYDFTSEGLSLTRLLDRQGLCLVFFLKNDNAKQVERNLQSESRDNKAKLFERADIEETVENTFKQQMKYKETMAMLEQEKLTNIRFVTIDTENKTIEEVTEEIETLISKYNGK